MPKAFNLQEAAKNVNLNFNQEADFDQVVPRGLFQQSKSFANASRPAQKTINTTLHRRPTLQNQTLAKNLR